MRRREFIAFFGGSAFAWSAAARAQQPLHAIGFLSSGSQITYAGELAGFRQGLSEIGWTEGINLSIHFPWAEANFERLPALAASLIDRHVSLIFANSVAARVAKNATSTISIVFTSANDPVEEGLVANINRPVGNVTGISLYFGELGPKRLQPSQELVPSAPHRGLIGEFKQSEFRELCCKRPARLAHARRDGIADSNREQRCRSGTGLLGVATDARRMPSWWHQTLTSGGAG